MNIHYRFALSLCGTMLIALATGGTTAQAANSLEIVIANGPHAGTYKLPTAHIVCMNIKSRNHFSAAYKNTTARDAQSVSGAGLNLFNPGDAGTRRGEINIRFGDPDEKRPATYETAISHDSNGLMFQKKGPSVELRFDGLAQNGTPVRLTAHCTEIDEF